MGMLPYQKSDFVARNPTFLKRGGSYVLGEWDESIDIYPYLHYYKDASRMHK